MRPHFVFFLLLVWARVLPAQTPVYLHYGVREGLSSNLVYGGLQDRDGLLWFGTDKGLARFDGARFRIYGMRDGLPDTEVFNLKEDRRGRLWMFCFRKKPCYRLNGKIVTAREDVLLEQINIFTALGDLAEAPDDSRWITGYAGNLYHLTDSTIREYLLEGAVNTVQCMAGHVIGLAGSQGKYYDIYPDGAWEQKTFPDPAIIGAKLTSGAASGNRLLMSTTAGLFLFELHTDGQFRLVQRHEGPVGRVCLDRKGRFWVCSQASGALCFDNSRRDLSNPVVYLPGKKVSVVFEDSQGTMWFCTLGEGLYALPRNAPAGYGSAQGLLSRNITAVARDAAGRLLVGDDEGNLFTQVRPDGFTVARFGSSDGYNRVRQILPLADGSRWVVTDESLHLETPDPRRRNVFLRRTVRTDIGHPKEILVEPGRIVLASSARLYGITHLDSLPVKMAPLRKTTVARDAQGNIWAGGIDELLSEKDGFQTNWGDSFPALKSRIIAIRDAGAGYLWVVTPENGLLRVAVRDGAVRAVDTLNTHLKTPVYNIQSLWVEPGGRLWLATNRGVYGLAPDERVVHFDSHDGLADDDVNAVLAHRDTLWIATANGLTRLVLHLPDTSGNFRTLATALRYRRHEQSVTLDLLDSLPAGHTISLPAYASLVQLELAGLDYRGYSNLRFICEQTALLPPARWWTVDNLAAWVWHGFRGKTDTSVVDEPLLSFGVHLPPGAYRLRITAINAAGIASSQPAEFTLVMEPDWYKNFWFVLFAWGAVIYGLWRVYRARVAYRELGASVSALQLQALQAQINPHFVGNSINAIQQFFYPPDPVRASEYIATFTGLLRRTLLFSEKTFIPFREELAYDLDYLQLIELRFGERFQFKVTGAERIPPDTPFPTMLLQILLENATMHGLAPKGISRLNLDFSWQNERLFCAVTDNGAGLVATMAHKWKTGTAGRKSKGLEMLMQKIETLNRLYDLELQFKLHDLSQTETAKSQRRGTRAELSFLPKRAPLTVANVPPALRPQTQTTS